MRTKGLILAGGRGTRLSPATEILNKHLIPILNKPMVLYPLETLKSMGITDIMIVSGGNHVGGFAEFLGDGSRFGVNLSFRVQETAGGIGQALGLAKDFVGKDAVAVVLGDNVFENNGHNGLVLNINNLPKGVGQKGAMFFFSQQSDNSRFGVPVFRGGSPTPFEANLIRIEEKPIKPKSAFAVTGLYIYPPSVFDVVAKLKPSQRGEIEISDVNNWYIRKGLYAYKCVSGFWSDAGTPESLKKTIDWAYEKGLDKGKGEV